MKQKEYIMHLLAEVSNYVLDATPSRMVISLHQESDGLHLAVIDNHERPEDELESMRTALNSASRPEMAEYYGSMGGADLVGHARLSLIGWQIKHADVTRVNKGTKIDLWLGSDRFDSRQFNIPEEDKT